MNTRTVYTMWNVNDDDRWIGDPTQAFDLDQLREYADCQEGLDRRVVILDDNDNEIYMSPARRTLADMRAQLAGQSKAQTELERSYREAPATMEQIRVIRDLLVERDLIAETRPAFRRRMQQIKSDMSILDTLTFEQALALWDALCVLPMDSSIDHIAFVNALYGDPETTYEQRCCKIVSAGFAHNLDDFRTERMEFLLSFS